jgi:hypothetical protein
MDILQKAIETAAVDSQTNASAVATLAAAGVGFKWRVVGWGASFSGAAVATPVRATLVANAITRGFGVSTTCPWRPDGSVNPFESADNGTVVLTLPAGGAGAVGDVYLHAFKIASDRSYIGP